MAKKGAYVIVGAQWGDEGKGLISAYRAIRDNALGVWRAGTGANAEHGLFLRDNKTYLKVNQLPLGWMFNPNTQIRIGSGVAVDPGKLLAEVMKYDLVDRVMVDGRCPIITREHILAEETSKGMNAIGSTFSGTGFCRADFVLRKATQARNVLENGILNDCGHEINYLAKNGVVGVESSQGFGLGLATSYDYPNVTSDNVGAMAACDDVLLSWKNISDVVLVVKALPSREGAGSFGSVPELAEQQVRESGMFEASSIGGVQRRKASGIDMDFLRYAVEVNGATEIALTFCEHYDPAVTDAKKVDEITEKLWELIDKIEFETKIPVTILNTGKAFDNIIDLSGNYNIDWEEINRNLEKFV